MGKTLGSYPCSCAGERFSRPHKNPRRTRKKLATESSDGHAKLLGMDAKPFGIYTKLLGIDAKRPGMDAKRLGIDAKCFGIATRRLGIDAKLLGIDTKRLGNEVGAHASERAGQARRLKGDLR